MKRIAVGLLAVFLLCHSVMTSYAARPWTFLAVGDSKTAGVCSPSCGEGGYEGPLLADLGASWAEVKPRRGFGGAGLAGLLVSYQNLFNIPFSAVPDFILLDTGTNDVYSGRVYDGGAFKARWASDLLTLVQAFHRKWPAARILIAYPRKYNTFPGGAYSDAWFDWVDAAINGVIAQAPYCGAGVSEMVYLRNHSADLIHPSRQGYEIEAGLWASILRSEVS